MPGISPRVNSRSRTPSSRRCSEVKCMVVPFGSALKRRSRTTCLSPDRDPGGEHPCRYCVHGYHLLDLSHGLRKLSSGRPRPATGYCGVPMTGYRWRHYTELLGVSSRPKSACPFVDYSPLAEAHERGDAVEAQWTSYRHTTARHMDHELIEAAYAQPQLRALFPFHSHRTLNFSRCTGFPYTRDIPVITPASGSYRVTWWHTRSPHGPADIGEADIPDDAVALVVALLPHNCGPAVAGTAEDLDDSDST
ncbi:DUF6193 family natural product biosynthesis protein [Streptomyces sp. NPDC002742]|uniref:DUF6193 family natural product biosynthesis protein n=1 Tax=Streptomyces sp. NPDC002742 TaxID=3364663 RepID=UPI00368CA1AC